MPDAGWTAADEKRLHERRQADVDQHFQAELASTAFETRLARRSIAASALLASLTLLALQALAPGQRRWLVAGLVLIAAGAAGVLQVLRGRAQGWIDRALVEAAAAQAKESARHLAARARAGFQED